MKKKLDLTEKTESQMLEIIAEKREELRTLRFSAAGARSKDSSSPKKLRADIARIMTERGNRARKPVAA